MNIHKNAKLTPLGREQASLRRNDEEEGKSGLLSRQPLCYS